MTIMIIVLSANINSNRQQKPLTNCAGSSGVVHNVVLIDVYLDLENPIGSGFWWGGIDGLLGEQKGSVYEHQGAEVDGS